MRPTTGDLVGGKYRVGRLIGDGGMGTVYEARHEVLGTPVALKFLHPELAKRPGLVARFLREAQVSARIQSAHVTRVTDVEQQPDGSAFLVMELLTGESLQEVLDRERRLPVARAIDWTLQILAGLEAAHAISVVHRDLKPDNVFVSPSTGGPLLRLLDFGIAKVRESSEYKKGLTRPGALMGTPEYMAPEQAFAADQVDHRADLYSAGAILYEMLSGARPAYGEDARAIAEAVLAGRVRRLETLVPDLPPGLADVVHRAVDPVPARRFASALDMRLALAPFAAEPSHAGRLAAHPGPLAERGTPPPVASTPPTLDDAPALSPVPGAAPIATAPDASPLTSPGTRQPSGTAVGPGVVPVGFGAPSAVVAAPAAAPAPWGAVPPRPRAAGRASGALLALALGVAVAGGGIALAFVARDRDPADEPPPLVTAAPPTTVAPERPADEPSPPDEPAVAPAPSPRNDPAPRPAPGPAPAPGPPASPAADAGAVPPRPTLDAGRPPPLPGIPLPPGFASAIPPGIPTTIPTFFPIPGFGVPPPAPAPSGR